MVCGEKRNYLTALIVPNFEQLKAWAKDQGIVYYETPDLADHPQLHMLIEERIRERCKDLARFEQIKKFKILNKEFSQEGGELTPTLKVRRTVIYERYAKDIDSMYETSEVAALPEVSPESPTYQSTIDAARRLRMEDTLTGMYLRSVGCTVPTVFMIRDGATSARSPTVAWAGW